MNKNNKLTTNRLYKSRLFEMIFSERTELLKLYNAMNGTNYDNPNLLEINTLENAIYMSMHNDISFIIDLRLTLYEHQSTYSPNLPLRYLFYVSDLYSAATQNENLYGTKIIKLPTPKFVIFYNGIDEQPDFQLMKLSDMYEVPEEKHALELEAIMLNINQGHNHELLDNCKTLRDYSCYTDKVRNYSKYMGIDKAVELAITECIENDILADFLRRNRMEAKKVSIYEYDEEKHMRQERDASIEEGMKKGEANALKLARMLLKAGRLEDLEKAEADSEFRQRLYKEFNMK